MTSQAQRAPIERVLVIIPTYNERDNLERIVARVRRAVPQAGVLVVDDASPDGTGAIADGLAGSDGAVHVLHRTGKGGLGAAYLAGFAWAGHRGYDAVVEMDADGSHAPEELARLLDALADADLVLGSRYVPGGRVLNWPRRREWLSRGGNTYVRLALDLPLSDATGGYRAYRLAALRTLDLAAVQSQGYCFQVDLAWRMHRAGYRVVEVPITFVERAHGTSKMSGVIVREALLRVTQWGFDQRVLGRTPGRSPAAGRPRPPADRSGPASPAAPSGAPPVETEPDAAASPADGPPLAARRAG